MNSQKRHLIITGVIAVTSIITVAVLYIGLNQDHSVLPNTSVGKKAYDFHVEWIQGKEFLPEAPDAGFKLKHFKGSPLVLNFWASWCVSCRQEAKELEKFWLKYQKDGVKVVGIAIQDTQAAAAKFAQAFGKTYILGLDFDGQASIDYGVTGVPETFIIDRQGTVVHKIVGPVDVAELEKYLDKIL